jgi:hypothetical protein
MEAPVVSSPVTSSVGRINRSKAIFLLICLLIGCAAAIGNKKADFLVNGISKALIIFKIVDEISKLNK